MQEITAIECLWASVFDSLGALVMWQPETVNHLSEAQLDERCEGSARFLLELLCGG